MFRKIRTASFLLVEAIWSSRRSLGVRHGVQNDIGRQSARVSELEYPGRDLGETNMRAYRNLRVTVVATALGLAALVSAGSSRADEHDGPGTPGTNPTVVQLNAEGSRFYKARDYRRAVEKFIQAYAIDRDPNLLFNVARCYEKLGDNAAAIEKYEEFLTSPGADAQGRQRAEESLAALRKLEEKADTQQPTTLPAPEPAPASTPAPAPESTSHSGTGIVPWLALGTGVASAGFGAILYALGTSDHDTVTNADGYDDPTAVDVMTESEAQSLVDSGNTKKLVGGIGLGVGGALIATSIVMFVTGVGSGASESVAVGVAPTPHGGAFSFQGNF
jgi:hypothetical protein